MKKFQWVRFKNQDWEIVKVGKDFVIRTGVISFFDNLLVDKWGPVVYPPIKYTPYKEVEVRKVLND